MAHTIRIKRRVSDSTAPTINSLVNGELAFNEVNDILYYRENSAGAESIIKIGGPGAFLTFDTNQTPTGIKTFSTTTLKVTGGSNGQVLSTNGSGDLSWVSSTANAFSTITGNSGSATASGADTLTLTGSGAISVAVSSTSGNDVAAITVASGSTTAIGVVQLTDSTSSTSTTTAATPSSVKTAYDLANNALPKAGGTMTGAITLAADPANPMEAATKQYVDNVATGLDVKASVKVATTGSNITLSGVQTIDGISVVAGDRVLVKDQTTSATNGIYTVAAGAWTRATDFDTSAKVTPGAFTFVEQGTTNADSGWVLTTDGTITLGTTPLGFAQFSGAGQINAGAGLTKSGNQLNVVTASTARIVVNADNIDLAAVSQTNTTGSAGLSFVQSHNIDSYGRVTGTVTAPIQDGSTSLKGVVQLATTINADTDKAATPSMVNTVKTTADAALARSGGTMTGKITTVTTSTSTANILLAGASADPSAPASGDLWNNNGTIKFYNGSASKVVAFTDSNITGTAAGLSSTLAVGSGGTGISSYAVGDLIFASGSTTLAKLAGVATGNVLLSGGVTTAPSYGKVGLTTHVSGTLAVGNGGTGATTFTEKGIIYGNVTGALQATAAGAWDGTAGTGALLSVDTNGTPTWTNTLDGGLYTT